MVRVVAVVVAAATAAAAAAEVLNSSSRCSCSGSLPVLLQLLLPQLLVSVSFGRLNRS